MMNKQDVLRRIKEIGVVPVVRASSAEEAMQVIEAIKAGPSIRAFVQDRARSHGGLRDVYNECLRYVERFRAKASKARQAQSRVKMLAKLLKTSRTQVDRILDPKNDITLGSLQRAAAMVGRRVTIELV